MTKGQRAMAVAMIYPEAENKGGRGKTSVKNTGVSDAYLKQARAVLRHSRSLAEGVLDHADVLTGIGTTRPLTSRPQKSVQACISLRRFSNRSPR